MIHSIIFIFGTIMGSFYGVVIDRLPKSISISTGRSRCDTCNRDLSALELIPILSFLIQGTKCRTCKSKLSWRYPLMELLTGFIFMWSYTVYGYSLQTLFNIIFASILIIVAFIDYDTMTIYDRFHILIIILAIVEFIVFKKSLLDIVVGALIVSVPLYLIAILTQGMGGGDIKLMFASGLLLGTKGILVAFAIAIILGGSYGIFALLTKKQDAKDAIPFGPFLCVGLFLASLYAIPLANWYLSLLIV